MQSICEYLIICSDHDMALNLANSAWGILIMPHTHIRPGGNDLFVCRTFLWCIVSCMYARNLLWRLNLTVFLNHLRSWFSMFEMPVHGYIQHIVQSFIWAKPKYLFCHGLERNVCIIDSAEVRAINLFYQV